MQGGLQGLQGRCRGCRGLPVLCEGYDSSSGVCVQCAWCTNVCTAMLSAWQPWQALHQLDTHSSVVATTWPPAPPGLLHHLASCTSTTWPPAPAPPGLLHQHHLASCTSTTWPPAPAPPGLLHQHRLASCTSTAWPPAPAHRYAAAARHGDPTAVPHVHMAPHLTYMAPHLQTMSTQCRRCQAAGLAQP